MTGNGSSRLRFAFPAVGLVCVLAGVLAASEPGTPWLGLVMLTATVVLAFTPFAFAGAAANYASFAAGRPLAPTRGLRDQIDLRSAEPRHRRAGLRYFVVCGVLCAIVFVV